MVQDVKQFSDVLLFSFSEDVEFLKRALSDPTVNVEDMLPKKKATPPKRDFMST